MMTNNSFQKNNSDTLENRLEALEWTIQNQNEKILELYKEINSLKNSDQQNSEKETQSKIVQLNLEENKENTNVENTMKKKKKRKKKTIKNEENIIDKMSCVKLANPADNQWLLNNLYHKKQDQNKDKRDEEETTHSPINDDIFNLKDNDMGPFFTPLVELYKKMTADNIDDTIKELIIINKFKKAAEKRGLKGFEFHKAHDTFMKYLHCLDLINTSDIHFRFADENNKANDPTPGEILKELTVIMRQKEFVPDAIRHMLEEYIVDKLKKNPLPKDTLDNIVRDKFRAYTKKINAGSEEEKKLFVMTTTYMDNIDEYVECRNRSGIIWSFKK